MHVCVLVSCAKAALLSLKILFERIKYTHSFCLLSCALWRRHSDAGSLCLGWNVRLVYASRFGDTAVPLYHGVPCLRAINGQCPHCSQRELKGSGSDVTSKSTATATATLSITFHLHFVAAYFYSCVCVCVRILLMLPFFSECATVCVRERESECVCQFSVCVCVSVCMSSLFALLAFPFCALLGHSLNVK